uniref:Uncharacterized protein n=1 Tax=Anguilla anguilla TaxID=7936 RepID=A0A0E9TCI0_ANGAN
MDAGGHGLEALRISPFSIFPLRLFIVRQALVIKLRWNKTGTSPAV